MKTSLGLPTTLQNLNGLLSQRSEDGSTIFIPLPKAYWRSTGAPCWCPHCKGNDSYWDTLALAVEPRRYDGTDYTWLVHRPGHHTHFQED